MINSSLAKNTLKPPILILVLLLITWFLLEKFWIADIASQQETQVSLEREKVVALQEVRQLTQENNLTKNYLSDFQKIDESWFNPLDKLAFIDKINFWSKSSFAADLVISFRDELEVTKESFNLKVSQEDLIDLLGINLKLKVHLDTDFLLLQKFIYQELGSNFILESCSLERNNFNSLVSLNKLRAPGFLVECNLIYLYLSPRAKEIMQ